MGVEMLLRMVLINAVLMGALALAVGCHDEEASSSSSRQRKVEPTKRNATKEPSARPADEGTTPPSDHRPSDHRQWSASERAQMRQAAGDLRRARTLARRGQYAEALAIFDRLIAATPMPARLRCEAGFVATRLGDLTRATALLDDGLRQHGPPDAVPPQMRLPLAQCLFNRGRVAEIRGHVTQAAGLYRTSLQLRPDAQVQARLDALGDVPQDEHADEYVEQLLARGPSYPATMDGPTREVVLARLSTEVCAQTMRASMMHTDGVYNFEATRCEHALERRDSIGTGAIVGIFPRGPEANDAGVRVLYVVLPTARGERAFGPIASTDSPTWNPADVTFERAEWTRVGSHHVLVIDVRTLDSATEEGCEDGGAERALILCSREQPEPRCAFVASGEQTFSYCIGQDTEGSEDSEEEHTTRGWDARWTFGPDGVRVSYEGGEHRATLPDLLAQCPLAANSWRMPACSVDEWSQARE